ncbi:MAG: protein translocase subunit SecF [Deltaproteobacteria bacterium]|nr:MAG: protein translocase subunit SecF [Deltaproteobacteria bacterium]
MQFIKSDTHFDFIGKRRIAFALSLTMILVSIGSLILHGGPRYGIDFAGGTLVQIKMSRPTALNAIKTGLASIDMGKASVQSFGSKTDNEFLVRTDKSETTDKEFTQKIIKALKASTGSDVQIERVEMVGPQVGKDLQQKALMALFFSLLFITIYISGRFEFKWLLSGVVAGALMGVVYFLSLFNVGTAILILCAVIASLIIFWFLELKYAMGAILALIHDVTIVIGFFSIFNKEFTLPIIAALLTIIGYSLNDTIIVFDRIRENISKQRKAGLPDIINNSINQTLSRTILTSTTTLFVVVTLFFFGGGIIHDFAFALIVGVGVGTYSSIFVASPILLAWQGRTKKKLNA